MKQVQFSQFGAPQVLALVNKSIPDPRAGEIIIKAAAIGVNFADTLRRRNKYFEPTPLPYTPGSEVVGHIVAVGEGVAEPYATGTMVLAILPFGGGYAQYVVAIAQYCIPLPPGTDAKKATAVFVQGSTAQLMITQLAKDLQGKTVLINAAAGGVGSILVQLAKKQGARVIAAAGSDEKLERCKTHGADETINYSTANWHEKVKAANHGNGVDYAFEMVGGQVYQQTLKAMAKGGHMIVYGCASGIQGHIHHEYFVDENLTQSGFNLAYYIQHRTPVWQQALGIVLEMLATNALHIETSSTFPLHDAALAHQQIEDRKTTGKVILLP